MNHQLIADSGSTKTDWMLLTTTGERLHLQTQGMNPVLMAEEEMTSVIQEELLPQLSAFISPAASTACNLHFYGAGVRPDQIEKMQQTFCRTLPDYLSTQTAHFASDLLGAAHALCGHAEGIACILGTGANSCLFDGERIVQNTPALGYILGDEGSGTALGKRFLNAIFKGLLPKEMRDDFLQQTGLTLDDIIRRLYREPMPNRFLASTSLYIHARIDHPSLRKLVIDCFREFFRHNIVPYQRPDLPVGFVGSIAAHYESLLREAAHAEGFSIGQIVHHPIHLLAQYHAFI